MSQDDLTPQEQLAAMRAMADQAVGGIGELAKMVAAMFNGLKDRGIEDVVALHLTSTWLTALTMSRPSNRDGDQA